MDLVVAGLDGPGPCTVELAFAVTDGDLQLVAEGPSAIIREPGLALDPSDDWRHADSGRPGCFDHEPTVDLHQAEVVTIAEPATDTRWDLALSGTLIQTSSGTSGPGEGGAIDTGAADPATAPEGPAAFGVLVFE